MSSALSPSARLVGFLARVGRRGSALGSVLFRRLGRRFGYHSLPWVVDSAAAARRQRGVGRRRMRSWTKGQGASSVVGGGGNCFMMRWAKVMIVFRYWRRGLLFSLSKKTVAHRFARGRAGGRRLPRRLIQPSIPFAFASRGSTPTISKGVTPGEAALAGGRPLRAACRCRKLPEEMGRATWRIVTSPSRQ